MKIPSLCLLALLWTGGSAAREIVPDETGAPPAFAAQQVAALEAVEAYIDAFNARDTERFAAALHYPHMRVDGLGRPSYWPDAAAYLREIEFDSATRTGWAYSRYDWKRVVQSGARKVHVLVSFTRYNQADQPLHTQESLYVVTEQDGRWAIQVRSSFLEQVQAEKGIR